MNEIIHYTISLDIKDKPHMGWSVGGIIFVAEPKNETTLAVCDWASKSGLPLPVKVWWTEPTSIIEVYPHPELSNFEFRAYAKSNATVIFIDKVIRIMNVIFYVEYDNDNNVVMRTDGRLILEITPI